MVVILQRKTKRKGKKMKIYDYYRSYDDKQCNKIFATFTDKHEQERKSFESTAICNFCKVTTMN